MGQKPSSPQRTTKSVVDLLKLAHGEYVIIMNDKAKVVEGFVVGKLWASSGRGPIDMVRLAPLPNQGFTSRASRAEQDFSLRGRTVLRVFVKPDK